VLDAACPSSLHSNRLATLTPTTLTMLVVELMREQYALHTAALRYGAAL
jgi:hypothetical protein